MKFKVGDKVTHKGYGDGVIIAIGCGGIGGRLYHSGKFNVYGNLYIYEDELTMAAPPRETLEWSEYHMTVKGGGDLCLS